MICEDVRLLIGAEPFAASREVTEHIRECGSCTELQLEMVTLEAKIRLALEGQPVGARKGRRIAARPSWAIAASVVFAAIATLAVWALRTDYSLAYELVEHVVAEPQSWGGTDTVSEAALGDVLRKSGVVLEAAPYSVVYARSCWFRGHYVPHLVVRTAHSLATVLILRNETVGERQNFNEGGLSGVIVPSTPGSIAVLAADGLHLDDLGEQMRRAVRTQNAVR